MTKKSAKRFKLWPSRVRASLSSMRLRTGARMVLAYGLVILVVMATTIVGVVQVRAMRAQMDMLARVNAERADLSSAMIRAIYASAVAIRNAAVATSSDAVAAQAAKIRSRFSDYEDAKTRLLASFNTYPVSDAERLQLTVAEGAGRGARHLMALLVDPKEGYAPADIGAMIASNLDSAQGTWIEQLEKLIQVQREHAALAVQQAAVSAQRATIALMTFGAIATLVCIGCGWLLTRSITSGIQVAVERSQRIAAGSLIAAKAVSRRDEFGDLLTALDRMRESISAIVGRVIQSSRTIDTASNEIAGGSRSLSELTDRAACRLQETASSMQQLTVSARNQAEAARGVSQIAALAADAAHQGGAVVARVVATMNDINASSKRIADIIGVIDGIAFQTNILALNAAVEAARAGEHGRGFAVVAGEVRSLAQRSAEAAKEIKALIGGSVERVEAGHQLVQDAGSMMDNIVAHVQRVTEIVGGIADGLAEQSGQVHNVGSSVRQLDELTQQNAALAEQSAASAGSLREQATLLTHAVDAFEVDRC